MQKVYCLSGLGADERVFNDLRLDGIALVHMPWISPLKKEELADYTKRLFAGVDGNELIVIGLSFGGFVAQELAAQGRVSKLILLASVKNRQEIPFYYRWAGVLGLHKLVWYLGFRKANFMTHFVLGSKSKEDRKLVKDIVEHTDRVYLDWSLDKIVNWQGVSYNCKVLHLHGTSDKTLPSLFIKNFEPIKEGVHLLPLSHAEELSKRIFKFVFNQ